MTGLILVRQKPGSAKGVTFMTIEDETDVANLVIWSALFEKQRRLILSSSLIGCRGRLQREGEVLHLIAEHFIDLSNLLRSIGNRNDPLPMGNGHRDDPNGATCDSLRTRSKDMFDRPLDQALDEQQEPSISVTARNFR